MKTKVLGLLLLLLQFGTELQAQVTVGIGEAPEKYATLQIKDKSPALLGGATALSGGLLLPRVELVKRYELLPFVNASELGTPDYESVQKPVHTGLMVYNLKEVSSEDLFVGVNQWDGEKWNALQEKMGNAAGSVTNCDSLLFAGQYKNKEPLNSSNYMTIPLMITKPGAYTISAIANPDNGYYFTVSGIFMSKGYYYLTIPGTGTPINYTPDGQQGDNIKITFNGVEITCSKYLKVDNSALKPAYTMDCNSIKVNGVYKINTLLDGTNTITMTLNVDPSATGATYIIKTNTVNGISFEGSGFLVGGAQTITLQGRGKPTSIEPKKMIIETNSSVDVSTCTAVVTIALTKKKILSIGTYAGNSYGYNFSLTGSNSNKLVTTLNNFGVNESSVVKVEAIQFQNPDDFAPSASSLKTALDQKPDVVIIGVWWNPDATSAQYLVDYMAKGGVVLAYMEEAGARRILQTLFGDESITMSTTAAAGAVYKYSYVNDEIMNGPFGDIRGLQWGEDASSTICISGIPSGTVTVYSTDTNVSASSPTGNGRLTGFRHNTLNFVFVGDGGFNSSAHMASASNTICPFNVSVSGFPIAKSNYGMSATNRFSVYNSIFTANALSWALKQAQFNGINK